CRSTKPGSSTRPSASMTWAPAAVNPRPISATTPSRSSRSVRSRPSTAAPRIRYEVTLAPLPGFIPGIFGAFLELASLGRSRRPAAQQQVEHGHADADAVGDLLDDGRAG